MGWVYTVPYGHHTQLFVPQHIDHTHTYEMTAVRSSEVHGRLLKKPPLKVNSMQQRFNKGLAISSFHRQNFQAHKDQDLLVSKCEKFIDLSLSSSIQAQGGRKEGRKQSEAQASAQFLLHHTDGALHPLGCALVLRCPSHKVVHALPHTTPIHAFVHHWRCSCFLGLCCCVVTHGQ